MQRQEAEIQRLSAALEACPKEDPRRSGSKTALQRLASEVRTAHHNLRSPSRFTCRSLNDILLQQDGSVHGLRWPVLTQQAGHQLLEAQAAPLLTAVTVACCVLLLSQVKSKDAKLKQLRVAIKALEEKLAQLLKEKVDM